MTQPVTVSKAQRDAFVEVMGHANNQPFQAIDAHVVLQ